MCEFPFSQQTTEQKSLVSGTWLKRNIFVLLKTFWFWFLNNLYAFAIHSTICYILFALCKEIFFAVFSSVSTNSNMSIMSNFHLWLWINNIWGSCIFANSSGLFGNMLVYCCKLLLERAKLARNISHFLLTFYPLQIATFFFDELFFIKESEIDYLQNTVL